MPLFGSSIFLSHCFCHFSIFTGETLKSTQMTWELKCYFQTELGTAILPSLLNHVENARGGSGNWTGNLAMAFQALLQQKMFEGSFKYRAVKHVFKCFAEAECV